jgi:hypothetical protein
MTDNRQQRFLEVYATCGNIAVAARQAQVDRTRHYAWLEDPEYRRKFEDAREDACDLMVAEARRRAMDGWEEPVVFQGRLQYQRDAKGKLTDIPLTIRKYDSTLLMFLIKGMRPEVYRDNYKADLTVSGNVTTQQRDPDLSRLTLEELKFLEKIAEKAHSPGVVNGLDRGHK